MLTLKVATDNAAFEGDALHIECARILRDCADKMVRDGRFGCDAYYLYDYNGNRVGSCTVTP
jgi:hypothetical protein